MVDLDGSADAPPPADVEPWLSGDHGLAVRTAVLHGMPSDSVALYGRWWQLEAWLRELVYVELRALYGVEWDKVVKASSGRQTADAVYTHMLSADSENPLAFLDYSQIIQLIDDHWAQFEYALITRTAWDGRQEELKRIRHRIGHMRKPHPDDVGRLEQTLRDLERGTFVALASYNDGSMPDPKVHHDLVTLGWIAGEHEDAQRLIEHARTRYDTKFRLRSARRPWAEWPTDSRHAPGLLWKAEFFLGERAVDAGGLWFDTSMNRLRPLLVHLLCDDPHHVAFTFSGSDDPTKVADAIGEAFDAVLMNSRVGAFGWEAADLEAWRRGARDVDYRLLTGSAWQIVDETTLPLSSFGAGGGVRSSPGW